jgi:hypothetical protein
MWSDDDMTTTTATTATTIPVVIEGRNYTIHLDQMGTTPLVNVYRITGTRKADGALIVHHSGKFAGHVIVTDISHLSRMNSWDLRKAIAPLGLGVLW